MESASAKRIFIRMVKFRLPYQYSLKTLFCAILLVCAFGTWGYYERQRPRQALSAVSQLRSMGWSVDCGWTKDNRNTSWWATAMDIGPMPERCIVTCHKPVILDHEFTLVAALQNVECLDLNNSRFSSAGFEKLRNLRGLRRFYARDSSFNDDNCAYLCNGDLETLHVDNTQVSDIGANTISQCSHLRFLHLNATKVTDAGLASIARVKTLQILEMSQCNITDRGVRELKGHAQLEEVHFIDTSITIESLRVLAGLSKIRSIRAAHCGISEADADALTPRKIIIHLREP